MEISLFLFSTWLLTLPLQPSSLQLLHSVNRRRRDFPHHAKNRAHFEGGEKLKTENHLTNLETMSRCYDNVVRFCNNFWSWNQNLISRTNSYRNSTLSSPWKKIFSIINRACKVKEEGDVSEHWKKMNIIKIQLDNPTLNFLSLSLLASYTHCDSRIKNISRYIQRKCTCQRKKKRCYCFRPGKEMESDFTHNIWVSIELDWTDNSLSSAPSFRSLIYVRSQRELVILEILDGMEVRLACWLDRADRMCWSGAR